MHLQTQQSANIAYKLKQQLENIRSEKQAYYEYIKVNERNDKIELVNGGNEKKSTAKNDYQPNNKNRNNEAIWEDNTTLIIGDSMIYGLEEEKMKRKTKIQMFRGSTIDDMYHYITPLLQKKPKNIILHVGTNNCVKDNSEQIVDKLRNRKDYINSILLKTKVIFSSLITRLDDVKARLTVLMTNKKS